MPKARACHAVVLVFAAACALAPAAAQPQAPHKPYKPVDVTLPAPAPDKSLDAFRKQLAGIAQRRDRAALARLVAAKDFFWEGDFGGAFNAKKSGFDNLSLALRLGDAEGRGWSALAAFASEATLGANADQPGARCAPANPNYDDAELAELTDATKSDVADWSYPRASGLPVRAKPETDAAVVETLKLSLVRVLGYESRKGDPDASRAAWVRIATPAGRTGYVPPGSLLSPLTDRLCFGKDAAGAWRIVGYVGGGD